MLRLNSKPASVRTATVAMGDCHVPALPLREKLRTAFQTSHYEWNRGSYLLERWAAAQQEGQGYIIVNANIYRPVQEGGSGKESRLGLAENGGEVFSKRQALYILREKEREFMDEQGTLAARQPWLRHYARQLKKFPLEQFCTWKFALRDREGGLPREEKFAEAREYVPGKFSIKQSFYSRAADLPIGFTSYTQDPEVYDRDAMLVRMAVLEAEWESKGFAKNTTQPGEMKEAHYSAASPYPPGEGRPWFLGLGI